MRQDARERAKWKVRLSDWVDGLPPLITRPVKKLMLETTFGILSSGRLKQSEIAWALPLKHRGTLRRGGKETVACGITRVFLREYPDRPLWMVVVRHGKREPLVLVTTCPVRGRRQGERLIHSYMDRWVCEEGYRFSKQGFDLEGVQARRFATLQNLVALASLAWGLLAAYLGNGRRLLEKAKQQKPKRAHPFPFYSLLAGWQRLFRAARMIFHPWLRARRRTERSSPPQYELLTEDPGLLGAMR